MSTELEYYINILINSMNLINIYKRNLKDMYFPIETYYHMRQCDSCDSIIRISNNTDYLYKCDTECTCNTRYCQIEQIMNREILEHDEMIYTTNKLIKQLDIRNDAVKNINKIDSRDRRLKYCTRCDNVTNIYVF
jgi:hypothetical protein